MSAAERLPEVVLLALESMRRDGGTQSRACLNDEVIDDYAERYRNGGALPPVVVFYDGEFYWLADGFHRCTSAEEAGKDAIPAEVRQGSKRDAILFSVGANGKHGLRRTNADKRRAVEMLLRDGEWGKWSDQRISEACGTSREFVCRVRGELLPEIGEQSERVGADGKVRHVPSKTPQRVIEHDPGEEPREEVTGNPWDPSADTVTGATDVDAPPPPPLSPFGAANEAKWWVCPGCGSEFNRDSADAHGWVKAGECGSCADKVPDPEGEDSAPAAAPKSTLDLLEELAAQRNADPEFAALRTAQRAISKSMPSRAQRVLDFVLDGGEIALFRLGLDWNVTPEALRQSYKSASLRLHPDHGGEQSEFVAVTEAHALVKSMLEG